jgi:hypothetical protein
MVKYVFVSSPTEEIAFKITNIVHFAVYFLTVQKRMGVRVYVIVVPVGVFVCSPIRLPSR